MKKIIVIILAILLAIFIGIILPILMNNSATGSTDENDLKREEGILELGMSDDIPGGSSNMSKSNDPEIDTSGDTSVSESEDDPTPMTTPINASEEDNKANDAGKKYKKLNISEENPIVYSSLKDIKRILQNGTGVIYFGFKECPWCRTAVPVLLNAAKEAGVNRIYYFNDFSIRDIKQKDEITGEIITTQEGSKEYYELLKILGEHASIYSGLEDDTIKRLYAPTVVFVKSGEILGVHVGTIDSQVDAYVELTDEQYKELKKNYTDYMSKITGVTCEDAC